MRLLFDCSIVGSLYHPFVRNERRVVDEEFNYPNSKSASHSDLNSTRFVASRPKRIEVSDSRSG
jgi:hypothetical protein